MRIKLILLKLKEHGYRQAEVYTYHGKPWVKTPTVFLLGFIHVYRTKNVHSFHCCPTTDNFKMNPDTLLKELKAQQNTFKQKFTWELKGLTSK